MTFKITCGTKQLNPHPLRHKKDYVQEILIDFEDGDIASLGWIAVMHDVYSGKAISFCLIDENGDNLPGLKIAYPSKKAALKQAHKFMIDLYS